MSTKRCFSRVMNAGAPHTGARQNCKNDAKRNPEVGRGERSFRRHNAIFMRKSFVLYLSTVNMSY